MFVGFLHCGVTFLSLSVLYFLEGSHFVQLTFSNREVSALPRGQSICIKYLEFFHIGDLFLFIYSVIHLYSYRFIGIYFVFWVIIQYYFLLLLQLFWRWPLGTVSVGSCVPLTCPIFVQLFLFQHFLKFWYNKMLQDYLIYFMPQS